MNTTINTALFCALVAIMFGAQAIDDHSAENESARQALAQQRQQERVARFERAAIEMCGNGGWAQDADGAVVCKVRRALMAGRVKL